MPAKVPCGSAPCARPSRAWPAPTEEDCRGHGPLPQKKTVAGMARSYMGVVAGMARSCAVFTASTVQSRVPRASRARRGVGGGAQHATLGVAHDRVAARERGQRAHRVEQVRERGESRLARRQPLAQRGGEAPVELRDHAAPLLEAADGRVRGEPGARVREARGGELEAVAHRCAQAQFQVVEALRLLAQSRARMAQAARQPVQPLPARRELALQPLGKARARGGKPAQQGVAVGRQQFRRGRGRRRAHVGDQVRDREVGLVAHGGDHGQPARVDRARDHFLVEGPQVLERAAAAPDQQHVERRLQRRRHAVRARDGRGDLRARALALHRYREHADRERRVAPSEHGEDVVQRGAGGRRDHAEVRREPRQCTLALGSEQAFGREPLAQQLERALQRARAGGLEFLDDELVFAACRVQAHGAAHQHAVAVRGSQARAQVAVAEHRAAHLRVAVLQREVPVTRTRRREVGDLALDPDRRERGLEQLAAVAVEIADAENPAGAVVALHRAFPSRARRKAGAFRRRRYAASRSCGRAASRPRPAPAGRRSRAAPWR